MIISFIKGGEATPAWLCVKNLLLNDKLTVESWVQFQYPHSGLITVWSQEATHHATIERKGGETVINIYQSGKHYKAISKALGLGEHGKPAYHK